MPEGMILKGVGGFYSVLLDKGSLSKDKLPKDNAPVIYTCKARGIHRKEGGSIPLPGDRVTFKILDEQKRIGHIDRIRDRVNAFTRPAVANIDQLAIVLAVTNPQPDMMLVDKLLITCQAKDIRPLIIINKTDLDTGNQVEALRKVYEKTGFTVLSLTKFSCEAYDILHKELVGFTTAFAGQSGVGKSTILNIVLNNWLMETGDVSERIQRGKHTTRHVQLFQLDQGGFILDTPGFSAYTVTEVHHEDLQSYYPEFTDAAGLCRFKGCSHISEPDCGVKILYDEGQINEGRYLRYTELYKELKEAYDNRYRR
ncbi:MAG: ribosome small subunit-dependent GTPase A [Clostridiaceae bacterium]|nr:ribosome small subunit-dependent GTPase A [Clostridiaceae bacterium]